MKREWIVSKLYEVHCPGACYNVRRDQSDQHHCTAYKRVEREFHGGILAPRGTPDCNQKILRNNGYLVKDEEEQQIEAEKDTIYAADQRQIERKKLFGSMLDVP